MLLPRDWVCISSTTDSVPSVHNRLKWVKYQLFSYPVPLIFSWIKSGVCVLTSILTFMCVLSQIRFPVLTLGTTPYSLCPGTFRTHFQLAGVLCFLTFSLFISEASDWRHSLQDVSVFAHLTLSCDICFILWTVNITSQESVPLLL